jgi:hypothetical protein
VMATASPKLLAPPTVTVVLVLIETDMALGGLASRLLASRTTAGQSWSRWASRGGQLGNGQDHVRGLQLDNHGPGGQVGGGSWAMGKIMVQGLVLQLVLHCNPLVVLPSGSW